MKQLKSFFRCLYVVGQHLRQMGHGLPSSPNNATDHHGIIENWEVSCQCCVRSFGIAIGVLLYTSGTAGLPVLANDKLATPEKKQLAEKLCADWNAQRTAIITAHLKYRMIESPTSQVPRGDFLKLLKDADLVSHPDNLKEISARVLPPLKPRESRSGNWSEVELWQEGPRAREEFAHLTLLDTQDMSVTYSKGSGRPQNHGQVDINTPGDKSNLTSARAAWYRFIPNWSPASISSFEYSDECILMRTKGTHGFCGNMVIDRATAMVLNMQLENAEGQPVQEYIQSGWVAYPGGILFPRLYVKADYRKGMLSNVVLFLLTNASFNNNIPESTFTLAAPAGTVVVDHRHAPLSEAKLRHETADVVKSFDSIPHLPVTDAQEYRSSTFLWPLFLVTVLCLLIVIFIARRFKKSSM